MAPKKSTIVLNVEQFIRDVEARPAIWNRNFHCNKAFLEQMWDELSSEHKLPKVVLKAKWKGLRDNFRVEYKRIPRTESGEFMIEPATFESKWIHYYALLFLTEHMRHRTPKNEQDQSYLFSQQSQDTVEKTVVEPDLTNGLISRLQDSDEDFDEDDVDDDDDDEQKQIINSHNNNTKTITVKTAAVPIITTTPTTFLTVEKTTTATINNICHAVTPTRTSTAALMALRQHTVTPPAAHSQSLISSTTQLFIKSEEVARSLLKSSCLLRIPENITEPPLAHLSSRTLKTMEMDDDGLSLGPEDLSTKFKNDNNNKHNNNNGSKINNINNYSKSKIETKNIMLTQMILHAADQIDDSNIDFCSTTTVSPTCCALTTSIVAGATTVNSQQHKKRSISPPPLYNKAHHAATPITKLTTATALNKDGNEYVNSNVSNINSNNNVSQNVANNQNYSNNDTSNASNDSCVENCYTNGLMSALKLKRPRLYEEQALIMENQNGSAKTTLTTTTSTPLVPEDDDYYYLLSLHPYMKQLTAAQKLRTRTKIQKLIFRELYKEDLEETK